MILRILGARDAVEDEERVGERALNRPEWAELACERRDDLLLVLGVDPIYRRLAGRPRYTALLRRVGL